MSIHSKTDQIKKWWEHNAQYYQEKANIDLDDVHYGPFAPSESKLKLLKELKGKSVLEIGCGGGQASIAMAKKGARCTGIDISEKQIAIAKRLAVSQSVQVTFLVGDMLEQLDALSEPFDVVFSAFAFQYISDLTTLFEKVFQVVKNNGQFVFSLGHPVWDKFDEKNNSFFLSYQYVGAIEQSSVYTEDEITQPFVKYTRKMSDIYNSLSETGFIVEKIVEPFDINSPSGWKSFHEPNVALCPPTIIFVCRRN